MSDADWFSMYTAILGAVIGAAVGGIATYLASHVLGRVQRRQMMRSAALKTLLKTVQIGSDIDNVLRHFQENIAKVDATGRSDMPVWAKVPVQASEARPLILTEDDFLPFIETGEFVLFEKLVTTGMRHQAICDAQNQYNRLRLELRTQMPVSSITNNVIMSDQSLLSNEVRLRIIELETLANSIITLAPIFSAETMQLANNAAASIKKHFGGRVPKFKDV